MKLKNISHYKIKVRREAVWWVVPLQVYSVVLWKLGKWTVANTIT
jgi:hypothetical protein